MAYPAVFLPGILMPASARYALLRSVLIDTRSTITKELEVYATPEPPPSYSLKAEVDGLNRFADDHALGRFHLYGHSAGGAIALAYVAEHTDRVVSLAVDEPASDFSDEDRHAIEVTLPETIGTLPVPERMALFARSLVRDGVELPAAQSPPVDSEMAKRPAGLIAFLRALRDHRLARDALRAFPGPVYYSYGSLSNERWETMARRLEREFHHCTVERFDGIHHLNTSHQAEPERVAVALQHLWTNAEAAGHAR